MSRKNMTHKTEQRLLETRAGGKVALVYSRLTKRRTQVKSSSLGLSVSAAGKF